MQYSKSEEFFNPHRYALTTIPCRDCGQSAIITVLAEQLFQYNQGAEMRNAFPTLSAAERERLLSGYCEPCWDELFPATGEDEDDEELGPDGATKFDALEARGWLPQAGEEY